jgi:hypothetical protein
MKPSNRLSWLGVAVIPTIAYILHDLVFQLPDNQGDVTPGVVLTIGCLLVVWGWCGYLMARDARGATVSVVAGAFAAAFSVAGLWLTFISLNALFLDRMSYEPDRILAFRRSGYATMREFWNHQRSSGPFPLLMVVAAVMGALGAELRRLTGRRASH